MERIDKAILLNAASLNIDPALLFLRNERFSTSGLSDLCACRTLIAHACCMEVICGRCEGGVSLLA